MIKLMSDGSWHSRKELLKLSHRYSATMHVLTKRGYKFEKQHVSKQEYKFRMVALSPELSENVPNT